MSDPLENPVLYSKIDREPCWTLINTTVVCEQLNMPGTKNGCNISTNRPGTPNNESWKA